MKLKINHSLLFAFAALLLLSCNSDDEAVINQTGVSETTPIAKEKVFDNVIVEGATKEVGAPNAPNQAVSFTLNKKNTNAVLTDGFDIGISSNDNVTGAYFQIKDTDGNLAGGYYDIDLSLVGNRAQSDKNKKSIERTNQLFKPTKKQQEKSNAIEDEFVVDVNFTPTIEPGTFCYVVCVYDAEGNISEPQEVCVTVQSWGGNDDLIGVWNFTKTEEFYAGETETINVGVENCDTYTLNCNNGSALDYDECYMIDSFKFTINSDGTYVYEVYEQDNLLDYNASETACDIIEIVENDHYVSRGNWAYDQQKEEFIIVEFEYTETDEFGIDQTETYVNGEAYVSKLKSAVNGNILTLTDEYFDANDIVEEYYKYYFDKE